MDIDVIRNAVKEIAAYAPSIKDEETIDEQLIILEDLTEHIENLIEIDENLECADILDGIADVKETFDELIYSFYSDIDDDEYGY